MGGIGTIREDSWSNLISTVENCAVVISRRGVRAEAEGWCSVRSTISSENNPLLNLSP